MGLPVGATDTMNWSNLDSSVVQRRATGSNPGRGEMFIPALGPTQPPLMLSGRVMCLGSLGTVLNYA
jgi:hypothetical protein